MVLNKSDQVDQQQLMRVYGALMWSLGKVFRSPEVRQIPERSSRVAHRQLTSSHSGLLDSTFACTCAPRISSDLCGFGGRHHFLASYVGNPSDMDQCRAGVCQIPQVCRVYIGSFNGIKPIREDINPQCKSLFEKEQADLLADLYDIPHRSCDRKVRTVCASSPCCADAVCQGGTVTRRSTTTCFRSIGWLLCFCLLSDIDSFACQA